jgi:uncharacterized protein YdeI (YjbR/CyaY-like superfamily)
MKPTFFATPADFRRWLARNHGKADELVVGFWKKDSGKPSITWPESVDEALCFGWIDGIRRRIDDECYSIRFTPRRRGSIWSVVNIRRATALSEEGRMQPAGLRAFEARDEKKSAIYAYENRPREFDPESEKRFRANRKAWEFFNAQPPSYRRVAIYFVMEAKKEETRVRRLTLLIDDSAAGRRLGRLELKPVKPSTR